MGFIVALPFFILAAIELHEVYLIFEKHLGSDPLLQKRKIVHHPTQYKPTIIELEEKEQAEKPKYKKVGSEDPFEWDVINYQTS